MPTPSDDETREEWMARCIPYLINEGRERDQAIAICSSMWDNKVMNNLFNDNNEINSFEVDPKDFE